MNNKTIAVSGAILGFAAFLFFALLPSLVYGGYAGILLATGIFGSPLPTHIFASGLVLFGMVLGVVGVGSVFTVAGAALVTLLSVPFKDLLSDVNRKV